MGHYLSERESENENAYEYENEQGQGRGARRKRRHSAGDATRELLLVTAERLYALHGIEGVPLRRIRTEAGQSNSSVIAYHFGSQAGLVSALIEFRYVRINARRAELLDEARAQGILGDPCAAVWLIVRPLLESIEAGEMFVPFLARVSADPRAIAQYLPDSVGDSSLGLLGELLPDLMAALPERARRGRQVQVHNSVLNLLAELARGRHRISEAQLSNYVDGWVGMLTAPLSAATAELMRQGAEAREDRS
ncbi:TetR/AcrR family transcriptional regulator [Streptomyces sp. NPDC056656]|uniref:TetR/AcrR family transcriptional regulator n=1 Tax=Streptomyces sp. NPDC056656 TaxID=3345895 RepID=UPI003674C93C